MSEATNIVQHPASAPPQAGAIYRAIPAIMAEVGAIEKGRKNQQQGYQFRGIDDVYAALQLVLAKHGVFVVPQVLEVEREEWETKNGGRMCGVRSKIRHVLYAADGSHVEAITLGEAMDTGDKASNKAMSVAMKYALIEVFCIPTSDPKDPENDSPEVKAKGKPEGKPEAPNGAAKPPASDKPPMCSHQQARDLNAALAPLNLAEVYQDEETAARLAWCSKMVGRKLERLSQLTAAEADKLTKAAQAGEMPQS